MVQVKRYETGVNGSISRGNPNTEHRVEQKTTHNMSILHDTWERGSGGYSGIINHTTKANLIKM